jgi:hypothetical protein
MSIGRVGRIGRVNRAGGSTAPRLIEALIFSNGTTLSLFFDKPTSGFASGDEGFALTDLSGGATTLSYSEASQNERRFTINRTVLGAETGGVLAYTPGDITATGGEPLSAFTGRAIVNNSTQT